jgi:hypothetical protein
VAACDEEAFGARVPSTIGVGVGTPQGMEITNSKEEGSGRDS